MLITLDFSPSFFVFTCVFLQDALQYSSPLINGLKSSIIVPPLSEVELLEARDLALASDFDQAKRIMNEVALNLYSTSVSWENLAQTQVHFEKVSQ